MTDVATIEARLRTEYPEMFVEENGVRRKLSAADYDARITEWVANEVRREEKEVTTEAHRALAERVRLAQTLLAEPVTTANAVAKLTQTRTIMSELIAFLDPRA